MNKKLKVTGIGINGEGIAYEQRKIVFIDGALPGEAALVDIQKESKTFKQAHLVKVIEASPKRIVPPCQYYKQCGGCSLMHAEDSYQLQLKHQILVDSLRHYVPEVRVPVQEVIASPHVFGYRNQAKLPLGRVKGKLTFGMYQAKSNVFVPIRHCMVQDPVVNEVLNDVLRVFKNNKVEPFSDQFLNGVRHVVVRHLNNQVQVTVVLGRYDGQAYLDQLKELPSIQSLFISVNPKRTHEIFGEFLKLLNGPSYIKAKLNTKQFDVSPRSFMQLNTEQSENMMNYVKTLVPQDSRVMDAYCGIGIIGMSVYEKCSYLVGVEAIDVAIHDAKRNAKRLEMDRAHFIAGNVEKQLAQIAKRDKIDCLIVDPPRTGLTDSTIEQLIESKIKRVIYVSCNPSTLGKNLKALAKEFNVISIQPFDLFPQTQHVETVVLLERKSKQKPKPVTRRYK